MDHLANLKPSAFDELFEQKTRSCKTYEQAYEAAELEHVEKFKTRKYANYQSYRQSRRKRIVK